MYFIVPGIPDAEDVHLLIPVRLAVFHQVKRHRGRASSILIVLVIPEDRGIEPVDPMQCIGNLE